MKSGGLVIRQHSNVFVKTNSIWRFSKELRAATYFCTLIIKSKEVYGSSKRRWFILSTGLDGPPKV